MSDLGMSVLVSRTLLGLDDLEINDHESYYVGPEFLGGQEQWVRNQVSGPYTDGEITVNRRRQNVTENIPVECLGGDIAELRANLAALKDAFFQDSFTVTITIGDEAFGYRFEAADAVTPLTGARLVENQVLVQFQAQRAPWQLSGASF